MKQVNVRLTRSYVPPPSEGTFATAILNYDMVWEDGRTHISRPTLTNTPRFNPNEVPDHEYSLPDTVRFLKDATVDMDYDFQWWLHRLCHSFCPWLSDADAKKDWASVMRDDAYTTNGAGSKTCADHVNGTNLNKQNMQLQPMMCGGGTVKVKGKSTYKGAPIIVFEAIDVTKDYTIYRPETHPWLWYRPVNSVRRERWVDGKWTYTYIENISRPFSQYDEEARIGIFSTDGTSENYLPVERLRILEPGEPFPYPFVYA